jgi:phosphatidylserine/phosphatidylglycerophosphate/cardiolipin synthase-like enzyme
MNDLWQTIAEVCVELHPDRVSAIAAGIERLTSLDQLALTRDRFGPNAGREFFALVQRACASAGDVSPAEVAAAFRAASAAAAAQGARGSVELVWSGPSTGVAPVRRTEQVVCEVIDAAFVRLFLVSFVAYKPDRIVSCLQAALARGVRVEILLESSSEHGGQLKFDSMALLRRELPTATFYTWKQSAPSTEPAERLGAVHAKCAVADGKIAFVSSANLTAAAMDLNMELGILVRGGHIPEQLAEHLEALSHNEIVVPA